MYLCREMTDWCVGKMGEEFGGGDDRSVIDGDEKIWKLMVEDEEVEEDVKEMKEELK